MDKELRYNEPWIEQRADPYVYRHTDGTYYFTASLPAYDGIALRCSRTLAGLASAEEVRIWNCHESGIMSFHIWAPELHYLKKEINVINLIEMRMDPLSPLQHQHFNIEMSNSSGIKVKDAVKIDAALKAMKVSSNTTIVSEAQDEARRILEYEIEF